MSKYKWVVKINGGRMKNNYENCDKVLNYLQGTSGNVVELLCY